MLFYVRKSTAKSKFQIPQVRVTLHEILIGSKQIYVEYVGPYLLDLYS